MKRRLGQTHHTHEHHSVFLVTHEVWHHAVERQQRYLIEAEQARILSAYGWRTSLARFLRRMADRLAPISNNDHPYHHVHNSQLEKS